MAKTKAGTSDTGRTHRKLTVNSQFKCKICSENMCYSSKGNLKRHMLLVHVPNFSKVVTEDSCKYRYFCPIHCKFSSVLRCRVVKHMGKMHPGMEAFPPTVQQVINPQKQRINVLATRENARLRDSLRRNNSPKFRVVPAKVQHIMRENVQDFMSGGFWASPRDLKDYLLSSADRRNEAFAEQREMHSVYNDQSDIKSLSNKTARFNVCNNSFSTIGATNNSVFPEMSAESGKNYVLPKMPVSGHNHDVDQLPQMPVDGRKNCTLPERPPKNRKEDLLPVSPADGRNNGVLKKTSGDVQKNGAIPEKPIEGRNYLNMQNYPATCDIEEGKSTTGKTNPTDASTHIGPADFVNTEQFYLNLLQADLLLSDSCDADSTDSTPSQGGGEKQEEPDADETIRHCHTGFRKTNSIAGNDYHEADDRRVLAQPCTQPSTRVLVSSDKCTTENMIGKVSMYAPPTRTFSVNKCSSKSREMAAFPGNANCDNRKSLDAQRHSSSNSREPAGFPGNANYDNRKSLDAQRHSSSNSRELAGFPGNVNCDNRKSLDAQRHSSSNSREPAGFPGNVNCDNRKSLDAQRDGSVRQHNLDVSNERQGSHKHLCIAPTIPLHTGHIHGDQEMYSQYNSDKVECWIAQHADFFGDSAFRSCEDIVSTVEFESEITSPNNMSTKSEFSTRAENTYLKPRQYEDFGSFRDTSSSECVDNDVSDTSGNSSSDETNAMDAYSVNIPNKASRHVSWSDERPRILLRFRRKPTVNSATYSPPGGSPHGSSGEPRLLQDTGCEPGGVSVTDRGNATDSSCISIDRNLTNFKNRDIFMTTVNKNRQIGTEHYIIPKLGAMGTRDTLSTTLSKGRQCNIRSGVSSECTKGAMVREDIVSSGKQNRRSAMAPRFTIPKRCPNDTSEKVMQMFTLGPNVEASTAPYTKKSAMSKAGVFVPKKSNVFRQLARSQDMKQYNDATVGKHTDAWSTSVRTLSYPLVNLNTPSSREDKRASARVNPQTGSTSDLDLPASQMLLVSKSSRSSGVNIKSVERSMFPSNLQAPALLKTFAHVTDNPSKRSNVASVPTGQPTSRELPRNSDTSRPDVRSVVKDQSWHQRVSPFKDGSWHSAARVDGARGAGSCSNRKSIMDKRSYCVPLATNCQDNALDSSSESTDSCQSTRRGVRPWRPSSQALQAS